jgi:archaellum component FlaF (FlaF/FlaG flagellin family)
MGIRSFNLAGGLAGILLTAAVAQAQASPDAPLPDARQLMQEVMDHQKQLEKIRESYTYNSTQTTQDIDANGNVTKTETTENEDFFVNGHVIERTVKKNGHPLSEHDQQKETERVTKLVEKAQRTPSSQPLEGPSVTVTRVLELMDVRNVRRETYRGRPAIVFDFVGRKDVRSHGLAEDASKKLKGTIWIDEADRQVAHLEASFDDNFHVAGGLVANIQKGSNFHFDQAPVEERLWLPTGGEGSVQVRVLLLKNMRQRFSERDYDYKRFRVETQQAKDATVVPSEKHE